MATAKSETNCDDDTLNMDSGDNNGCGGVNNNSGGDRNSGGGGENNNSGGENNNSGGGGENNNSGGENNNSGGGGENNNSGGGDNNSGGRENATNEAINEIGNIPKCCSCRWIFCYVSCVSLMFALAVRVDMSVAMVCMLKNSVNVDHDVTIIINNNNNKNNIYKSGVHDGGFGGTNSTTVRPLELCPNQEISSENHRGEFEWSNTLQSNILAGYFYGYILTNLLGGLLADRYGGKIVFGWCILSSSVLTLLFPSLSRISDYFTLALRILIGLVSGPFFPAMHSLWGRWAPASERSKLMSLCYSGPLMGNILTLTASGYLCAHGFDNGWGSIFYLVGIGTFVCSMVWFYAIYDSPQVHPRISQEEKLYLSREVKCKRKVSKIPWREMSQSSAVWAIVIAHISSNWTGFTLITVLPLYMKEALNIDIKSNGLMSSAPFLGQLLTYNISGRLADIVRSRGYLSTRYVRAIFQVTGFVGTASFFVATGFVKCHQARMAVIFLFLAGGFMGLNGGGFMINHVDIAPSYAGVLFGITNTFAALPGFLAPIIARTLTPNGTQSEWQNVLFLCATFSLVGAIAYGILAKGDVQSWAQCEESSADDDQVNGHDSYKEKC